MGKRSSFVGLSACMVLVCTAWVSAGTPQLVLEVETRAWDWVLLAPFLREGIRHILTGYDHLLFIAGLMIASRHVTRVALLITAFTVAHSVSLAMSVSGWVDFPPRIVEGGIALTITWVAVENLWLGVKPGDSPGGGRPNHGMRWWMVFLFGLCHGLGFSSAVKAMLPGSGPAVPLLGFNIGVELGQGVFVCLVGPLWWWATKTRPWAVVFRWMNVAMLSVSIPWFIQRAMTP